MKIYKNGDSLLYRPKEGYKNDLCLKLNQKELKAVSEIMVNALNSPDNHESNIILFCVDENFLTGNQIAVIEMLRVID